MAEISVDRLIVDIEARTRQFETQLKKLEGKVSASATNMNRRFYSLNKTIASAGMTLTRAFGATLGVGLLAQLPGIAARSVTEMGNLTDASQKAGVSIEDLQRLTFAGLGTGTGEAEIVSMMEMFNKRIGEAATKGGDLARLFAANGVSLRDQNGQIRSNVDLLAQVADLVKNARTEQEATVVATMALGRSGAELLPYLKQGGDEMRRLMGLATETGFVIDSELVRAADEFSDKWGVTIAAWGKNINSEIATIVLNLDLLFTKAADRTATQLERRAASLRETIGRAGSWDRALGFTSEDLRELEEIERALRDMGAGKNRDSIGLVSGGLDKQLAALEARAAAMQVEIGASGGEAARVHFLSAELAVINEQIAALRMRRNLLDNPLDVPSGPRAPGTRDDRGGLFNSGLGSGGQKPTIVTETVEKVRNIAKHAKEADTAFRGWGGGVEAARMELTPFEQQLENMGAVMESEFSSAFARIIDGTESVGQAFESLVTDILKSATKMLADQAFQRLFQGGFTQPGGIAGGWLQGLLDGFGPAPLAPSTQSGGGGGGTRVYITNTTGAPVRNKQSRGASGERIDIMIGDLMEAKLPGLLNKTMPSQFGLRPLMTHRT